MSEIFGKDRTFSAELSSRNVVVKVDGHDIANHVRGFRMEAGAGQEPRVELELAVFESTRIEAEKAEVFLAPGVRQLLIDAGWQAPESADA